MHAAFHYVLVPWGFVAVTIVRFETGPYSCMHSRAIFPTRRIKLRLLASLVFTTLIRYYRTSRTIINSKQVCKLYTSVTKTTAAVT